MPLCTVILLFTTFTAGLDIYISKQKLFYFFIAHSSQLSYVESSSKRPKQALVSRTVLSRCAAKTQTTMNSISRSKGKIEIAPVTVLKEKKDEKMMKTQNWKTQRPELLHGGRTRQSS